LRHLSRSEVRCGVGSDGARQMIALHRMPTARFKSLDPVAEHPKTGNGCLQEDRASSISQPSIENPLHVPQLTQPRPAAFSRRFARCH
jgi:hypothetical protein